MMNNMSQKLKRIRQALNLKQKEMAEKLGVSLRAYQHWEYGDREIPLWAIRKLIGDLRVNPEWLFLDRGDMFFSKEYEKWQEDVLKHSKELRPVDYRYIPIVGYVSAGVPKGGQEENLGWMMVELTSPADKALIVDGDSMEPTIPKGSVVAIKPVSVWELKNGDVVVVRLDGEHALKRVYFDKQKIILRSDNPKYKDIIVDPKQAELIIEGKAIKVQMNL